MKGKPLKDGSGRRKGNTGRGGCDNPSGERKGKNE